MITHKRPRSSAVATQLKRVWLELDDATLRMFDIRTGERLMEAREKAESRGRAARRTAVRAR